MTKYKIGDRVKVINAGSGATGCNGSIGIIVKQKPSNGLFPQDPGINILIKSNSIYAHSFEVWRIAENGLLEKLDKE